MSRWATSHGLTAEKPKRKVLSSKSKIRAPKTLAPQVDARWHQLAEQLAATEVSYVDHPNFRGRAAERWLESQRPSLSPTEPRRPKPFAGIAFVPGLVQAALLTPAEERYLFLKMNYLKSRAEQQRRRIKIDQPAPDQLQQIEDWLAQANAVRNQIVEANLRLVVSVAKKLSNSLDQLSELTSEGLLPLMRAVELFDVHLGNRFSTYATWAVRNQMHRTLKRQRGVSELSTGEDDAGWDGIPDRRGSATADMHAQIQRQRFLVTLIDSLNERERRIIAARFGLDGQPSGQSLAEISGEMGLSKERIRQIAMHALEKLRAAASASSIELTESWCAEQ